MTVKFLSQGGIDSSIFTDAYSYPVYSNDTDTGLKVDLSIFNVTGVNATAEIQVVQGVYGKNSPRDSAFASQKDTVFINIPFTNRMINLKEIILPKGYTIFVNFVSGGLGVTWNVYGVEA